MARTLNWKFTENCILFHLRLRMCGLQKNKLNDIHSAQIFHQVRIYWVIYFSNYIAFAQWKISAEITICWDVSAIAGLFHWDEIQWDAEPFALEGEFYECTWNCEWEAMADVRWISACLFIEFALIHLNDVFLCECDDSLHAFSCLEVGEWKEHISFNMKSS